CFQPERAGLEPDDSASRRHRPHLRLVLEERGQMKKLRVGVVGVGHIGSNHARLYSEIPVADFTAIYDIDLARANAVAKKYGTTAIKSLDQFAELVDAASIATPTNTHHEIGVSRLQRGKHLLLEQQIP